MDFLKAEMDRKRKMIAEKNIVTVDGICVLMMFISALFNNI